MAMMKYRVHEVAKDFNTTSKVITQILTDYLAPPKNHMQVLENPELDVIFEYMTQHNQVASLEDIFKVAPPEKKPEPQPEKPAEEKNSCGERGGYARQGTGTESPAAEDCPAAGTDPADRPAPEEERKQTARAPQGGRKACG